MDNPRFIKFILKGLIMIHVFYGCARRHRIVCPYANVYTLDIEKKAYCSFTGDIRKILNEHYAWLVGCFDGFIFTPHN